MTKDEKMKQLKTMLLQYRATRSITMMHDICEFLIINLNIAEFCGEEEE